MTPIPLTPALVVIQRFGITEREQQRLIFAHAAGASAYQWECATGYKGAEVSKIAKNASATFTRLIEAFGPERAGEIDEALFQAEGEAVSWALNLAEAA